MADDVVLVGDPGHSDNGFYSGTVFRFDPATGLELGELLPLDGAAGDPFGGAVAIDGNLTIVGPPWASTHLPDWESGATYAFDATTGRQLEKLTPAVECALGAADFGTLVALRDTKRLMGAGGCDGAAQLFEVSLASAASFCDGAGCPCGNDDPPGGCIHGTGVGARLTASGSTRPAADDLVLSAENLPANQLGLLFMGDQEFSLPFGNGLRCVKGSLFRSGPPLDSGPGGGFSVGPGLDAASRAPAPATSCITGSSVWNFQAWYRDASGPCGASFNVSNAIEVLFGP